MAYSQTPESGGGRPWRPATFWERLVGRRETNTQRRELFKQHRANRHRVLDSLNRQKHEVMRDLDREREQMMRKYGLHKLPGDDPQREKAERYFEREFGKYEKQVRRQFRREELRQLNELKKGYRDQKRQLYEPPSDDGGEG